MRFLDYHLRRAPPGFPDGAPSWDRLPAPFPDPIGAGLQALAASTCSSSPASRNFSNTVCG
jgi:hypothetical protein